MLVQVVVPIAGRGASESFIQALGGHGQLAHPAVNGLVRRVRDRFQGELERVEWETVRAWYARSRTAWERNNGSRARARMAYGRKLN